MKEKQLPQVYQGALVPIMAYNMQGYVLVFALDGIRKKYTSWPSAVTYEGRIYVKTGWDSDTSRVYYKQGSVAVASKGNK